LQKDIDDRCICVLLVVHNVQYESYACTTSGTRRAEHVNDVIMSTSTTS